MSFTTILNKNKEFANMKLGNGYYSVIDAGNIGIFLVDYTRPPNSVITLFLDNGSTKKMSTADVANFPDSNYQNGKNAKAISGAFGSKIDCEIWSITMASAVKKFL